MGGERPAPGCRKPGARGLSPSLINRSIRAHALDERLDRRNRADQGVAPPATDGVRAPRHLLPAGEACRVLAEPRHLCESLPRCAYLIVSMERELAPSAPPWATAQKGALPRAPSNRCLPLPTLFDIYGVGTVVSTK